MKKFPVTPPEDEEVIVFDLLLLELEFFTGHAVDQADFNKIQAFAKSDFIYRLFQNLVKSEIDAISAIMKHDKVALNKAMTDLVNGHAEEATVGELRKSTKGMMSFSGLMLSKITLSSGLQSHVNSKYVPFKKFLT